MRPPITIANASGFWGDRASAPEEMVLGGAIGVLTGDYLAELSLAILAKARMKDPRRGFVPTFLEQAERVLGACLDRGISVVTNAGGLNPLALGRALEELAARLGRKARIAVVLGDDLAPRLAELRSAGVSLAHLDHGTPLGDAAVLTANAYLGAWGIREALARGADVVVTGRVVDAALVIGPAAHWFGWARDDFDALAGAAAAGHLLECGAQVTGGNFSFFEEVPSLANVGFPLAVIEEDGSFTVSKHPGTGGLVSVDTVTAQLLYEIDSPRYVGPDVVAMFDHVRVEQVGADRVRVSGARGDPPPRTAKVAVTLADGFRNTLGVLFAGLDVEAKARVFVDELFRVLGGRDRFARVDTRFTRFSKPDPERLEDAIAELRVTVFSPDEARVGRAFSSAAVELALVTAPGITFTAPPGAASPNLVYFPALVDRAHVEEVAELGGERWAIPPPADCEARPHPPPPPAVELSLVSPDAVVRAPLGRVFGARSGDKGSHANLGVWARTDRAHGFLRSWLTVPRLRSLLPDVAPFPIDRHELPNVRAVNFVIRGFLEGGAIAGARLDPQAKTLAEYFRARLADLPRELVP